MKKHQTILSLLIFVTLAFFATNCKKSELKTNQEELLGTWVSIDKTDTLEFTSENDFYKSNGDMSSDHYDYELFNDSIEIRYNGILFILVHPTNHKYSINNNQLTIDFSNKMCYGFNAQEISYTKEK